LDIGMKQKFTIKDVIKALDIPRERFKEWIFRGYIEPSIQKAEGPGSKNLYSRFDLYAIRLFDYLLKKDFFRREASFIVNNLFRRLPPDALDTPSKILMIAFFRRKKDHQIIKKRGLKGPYMKPDGKIVSNKGLAPGLRIITDEDIEKSFSTLFLTFDDVKLGERYHVEKLRFEDVFIVDFKALKEEVDAKIKLLE
jgi:hypothetical protein